MKILIREEQLKLIEQLQRTNPNIFIKPDNWTKIEAFTYKNKPVTLYYNNKTGEYHLNDIGTKNTRQLPKSEYGDVGSATRKDLNKFKSQLQKTKNPVSPNPVSPNPVKPNPVSAVKTNPEEQRWVGIWEKFLVKYVSFTGGDKDNLTGDIDNAVYKFISQNKKLYTKNKNINLGNLQKLMTDGKKGPVHDSFLPPYYYNTDTFPIYFYQKSNKIMEIQKKLGVKQTGIFLNQTERAILKKITDKNKQGYNIKYDRKTGITEQIYQTIMSPDIDAPNLILKNLNKQPKLVPSNATPNLIPTKQNTSLEPVSNNTDLSNRIK